MSTTSTNTSSRRIRPQGRSAFQEHQSQRSRAAILVAAADVFAAKGYVQATIDDILSAAAISRATFYTHFASKLTLASAIYDGIEMGWLDHFDQLASPEPLADEVLVTWIADLAALYVRHGYITNLVEQLVVFEPGFRRRIGADRDSVLARLAAAGVPGCLAALGAGPAAAHSRAAIRLLLHRLDQVCGMVAHADLGESSEIDACVEVVADEIASRLWPAELDRLEGRTSSLPGRGEAA